MMKSYKLYKENRKFSLKNITVFDLDDVLSISAAKIKVKDNRTNKVYELTPAEFNEYETQDHHELDFSDFESYDILKAGELIHEYLQILEKAYKSKRAVSIVTARSDQDMIFRWMKDHVGFHITKDLIFAVNDPIHRYKGSIAEKKEQAFIDILNMGYSDLEYYDDDISNVRQIRKLLRGRDVKFKVIHVK